MSLQWLTTYGFTKGGSPKSPAVQQWNEPDEVLADGQGPSRVIPVLDRPEGLLGMPRAQFGQFVLHRFNGHEVYDLSEAEMLAVEAESGLTVYLEAHTAKQAIVSLPDTVDLRAHPSAEIQVALQTKDPRSLVGQTFTVPYGCTDEDGWIAHLYYCEHEDLDENVVRILSRDRDMFTVQWEGTTVDVNYHDGSRPRTRMEIYGVFRFIDMHRWLGPETKAAP